MKKETGAVVDLRKKVKVKALKVLSVPQHLTVGKEYEVSPAVAENYLKNGIAEYVDKDKQKSWEKENPELTKKIKAASSAGEKTGE